MIKELSNKYIYEDFIYKTKLTEDEQKVLDMLIKRWSIIKISQEICMSDRNVGRVIRDLKDKYNNYKQIEVAILEIFKS